MSRQSLKRACLFLSGIILTAFISFNTPAAIAGTSGLKLNDKEYFETRGFNVLVFENEFNGMFFDEKTAAVQFIHHEERTATGGAVRLKPTPEQWDQIPKLIERHVDKENNMIEVLLRYEDFDFDCRMIVRCEGGQINISVLLDEPLPDKLAGRAGLNIEFLPSAYFGKTYIMDETIRIFPRHPANAMAVMKGETQLRQFAGHQTYDDRGRNEYVEPLPLSTGHTLVLAPEDSEKCVEIKGVDCDVSLLDGRSVAQNGWFVVRSLIPENKTGKVAEWQVTPHLIENWLRPPMIAHSQVGYHPAQPKKAVIELDKQDDPLSTVSLLKLEGKGVWQDVLTAEPEVWGIYLRYNYLIFDFSSVQQPGHYKLKYGDIETNAFPINEAVYESIWQPTLDVWFPVQMDHLFVNEGYRVWHGAAHLDDAVMAPLNHQHFDGFAQGDSTDSRYQPGERIPGMNIGGWFDAGDFDIRTNSHCQTVSSLVESWEQFKVSRDETLVDQTGRYVDMHHPDGKADLLQQIEHGTLALIAQHRAFGRAIQDMIVPHLHQYHHLGDASTMTDNLIYNPELKPYETDGVYSGTPDDRWVFTNRSPGLNYSSIASLAGASRALKGYNDALSEECLTAAIHAWKDEQSQPPDTSRRRFWTQFAQIPAALQLYISTGEEKYKATFESLLWPAMERGSNWMMGTAVQAVPHFDDAYREKLIPFVQKYQTYNDDLLKENPFGVSMRPGGWAGNGGIIRWASTNYLLHQAFPEIIGSEYTYRGLDYIFGCHPTSNVSFVSGVGLNSKTIGYGNNRADYSFIAGGVVPGVMILKPDFPEHKLDWPFLWGENEYVIDVSAGYIFLGNAVNDLIKK